MRRAAQVAESHHRQSLGHADPSRGGFEEHAGGKLIGAAEYGIDARVGGEQPSQPVAPHSQRRRRAHGDPARDGDPALRRRGREPRSSRLGSMVVRDDQRWLARTAPQEVLCGRRADLLVGEADQHVDRRRGQVPGLDHRDARAGQTEAELRRMHDAREDDAVGTVADGRLHQLVLRGHVVVGQSEKELVAGSQQLLAERMDQVGEHRVQRARHDGDDEPASLRGEAACNPVRNVSEPGGRRAHPLGLVGGDEMGLVERPRRGHR